MSAQGNIKARMSQGRNAFAFAFFGVMAFFAVGDLARDVSVLSIEDYFNSPQRATTHGPGFIAENSTAPTSEVEIPQIQHDVAEKARNFVAARRAEYHKQGLDYRWKLRGVGYLYTAHNLILLATLPEQAILHATNKITIHNVSNKTVTECEKYSIWVRVNGPEIFAGEAQAVTLMNGSCFWIFPFDLRVPGSYEVDVKLLLWNGNAPILENQCESQPGLPSNIDELKHDGFQGFKMYSAPSMCCEICSRTPHCISWASPFLRMDDPSSIKNGCELFFEADAPDEYVPVSHLWPPRRRRKLDPAVPVHGKAHRNPTSYFMGCGWSFWFTLDFPCLSGDMDDRVFSVETTFEVTAALPNIAVGSETPVSDPLARPRCTLEDETLGSESVRARWVREPPYSNVTAACPPLTTAKALNKDFQITTFEHDRPECWRREDLSIIGAKCVEMNCRLIQKGSIWRSSLHNEQNFAGSWQPYSCRYVEFSTRQLQECVTKRKIASFSFRGTSVADFMDNFVQYRLLNITLYPDKSDPEAIDVVYDTLGLLHQNGPDGSFEQELAKLPIAPQTEEHYWISPFFLSSEREVHTHMKRMERYNNVLPAIVKQKGYRTITAFDLTAAFTFDSATQNDGMHMIGPPMKAIVTKLFHHVCAQVS